MKKFISVNTHKAINELKPSIYYEKKRNRVIICNDDILTFDIECSSGFIRSEVGTVEPFDKTKGDEYYRDCEKVALMYVWQLSINEHVFMGRTLEDLREFMQALNEWDSHVKYVYVHNLSYEFQCALRNLYNDEFDEVFAREKRKVMYCKKGSVTYRCSYFLTNMSLATWAEQKKLPVKKMVGDLDYIKIRTPYTNLTEQEKEYCIHDCLVMYEGLKLYKQEYGSIYNIPLTQTGEVRREIQKRMNVSAELKYRKRCAMLIPDNIEDYKLLVNVFQGGYTHACYKKAGRTIKGIINGKDIASSYPTVMCVKRYPITRFSQTRYSEEYENAFRYSYIIQFECKNLRSRLYNSYWSVSHSDVLEGHKSDNGRVISAKRFVATMTNIDFTTFKRVYDYEDFTILDFRVAVNGWLSPTFIKYVLELYGNKTQLKGIDEQKALYAKSKQYINSMFGCAVLREFTDEIVFDREWSKDLLDLKGYTQKVAYKRKCLSKIFTAYQFGCWVTAYARQRLWDAIIELDRDLIYTDTDSVYYVGDHEDYFNSVNAEIEKSENEVAERLNVSRETFAPLDKKGIPHRLGIWDSEHDANSPCKDRIVAFKTLGAKKYIFQTADGKLHMTVSGVRKSAVSQINCIEEFNDGLIFDVDHAGKLLPHYLDDMPQVTWNKGQYDEYVPTSEHKHGICMQPTTYSLGITLEYLRILLFNRKEDTEIFKHETKIL